MGDVKITGLIGENEIQTVKELDTTLERVKATYVGAAKELAKGLKINVEVVGDLDKLNTIYVTQAKNAKTASNELTDALKKQSEVSQEVAKRLEEQVKAGNLSATEMKKVTAAGSQNAAALEKMAKAEAALEKAQNTGVTAKKKTSMTEEERLKLIKEAIALTNREVHSIVEAREANKQLHQAVNLLKDTDEGYIKTLARLNSTIGVNTDYVKRNADSYTQQKMAVGDYKNQIKQAMAELRKGESTAKNFGVALKGVGGVMKSEVSSGIKEVSVGVGSMIKGMIGAQAIIGGIQKLFGFIRSGVGSIIDFEAANSKLAAILGTTSKNMKDLISDAQRLGATTKYTASEATNLQIELAKLGFSKKEILQSTESILKFAQATGAALPDAAALAGASLRMFGAETRETERYVSAMAVATSKSALSFSYLQTAMPIVGPVAKAFNFQIEDTLALLGKLSDAGFDASMASTATRNILLNLADESGKLAKALGAPVKTLPDLVDGLKKLKEQGIDLNSTLELTDKRSVAAFNAFLTAADKIVPLREQITGVGGDLSDMANTMGDNVQGAIAGLSSAWEAFMLSFSESTGPMKSVLDFLAKGLRGIAMDLRSYSQLQDDADNKAMSTAQREMATSDILQKNRDNMSRLYKEKLNEGMSADEAAASAKEEYLNTLKSQLDTENMQYNQAIRNREIAEENLEERGVSFGFGVNKALKDSIKNFTTMAAGKKAVASITESVIEDLNNVDLKQAQVSGKFKPVLTDKEKAAQEKAAKEQLKIRETCQQSELALMDEGYKKEVKKISLGYAKKIAAIRGGGKEEMAAKEALGKEQQKAIDDYTIQYNSNREKQDIANALEVVKEGSKEELDLKMRQLDLQREAEIDAAVKTGEDVLLVNDKYEKKKQDLKEEHASKQILLIADNAAAEQVMRDQQYQKDMTAAAEKYANDLKAGKDSVIAEEEYEENKYQITLDYTRKSTEAAIDALEMELKNTKLSDKDRAKIAEELQAKKAQLAEEEANAEIRFIKNVEKEDEKSKKKRIKNVQQWLNVASEAVGAIGDLVSTVYDGQISKIEEEQELNDVAYDREIERTDTLVQQKVITEEEGEARKRAAKAKTEAANEELEKRKAALAYKQAVWEKATGVSQAGIATALAIMNALQTQPFPVGVALAAVAGAMGAIQIATILATPIPSYAEGTKGKDGHPGGTALVGDAGKREVVMFGGSAWITPDSPTLVDLPKGAQVFPDVDVMDFSGMDFTTLPASSVASGIQNPPKTIVVNDYSKLERGVGQTNTLLRASIKQQHRDTTHLGYRFYKRDSI